MSTNSNETTASETTIVRSACPQDCPDTCAFLYHVKDEKPVAVTGDPDHPMTRGGLCVKLNNFAEHHYHPDRLLHPMKRTGPKGRANTSASAGTRRWRRSSRSGPRSSTSTAARRSCRMPTSATTARPTG